MSGVMFIILLLHLVIIQGFGSLQINVFIASYGSLSAYVFISVYGSLISIALILLNRGLCHFIFVCPLARRKLLRRFSLIFFMV